MHNRLLHPLATGAGVLWNRGDQTQRCRHIQYVAPRSVWRPHRHHQHTCTGPLPRWLCFNGCTTVLVTASTSSIGSSTLPFLLLEKLQAMAESLIRYFDVCIACKSFHWVLDALFKQQQRQVFLINIGSLARVVHIKLSRWMFCSFH